MTKEQKLIGCLINSDKKTLIKVLKFVDVDDFKNENKLAFKTVKNAVLSDKIVHEELLRENVKLSDYLTADILVDSQLVQKAKEIKQDKVSENVKSLFRSYQDFNPEKLKETIGEFQEKLLKVTREYKAEKNKIKDILFDYEDEQKEHANKDGIIGISTGISKLDAITDGLRKEHFCVIGGNTSSGKTFLALNMLWSVLANNRKAVFYSLEMGKSDIVSRILGIMSNMNGSVIYKMKTTPENLEKANDAKALLYEKDFSIYSEVRDINDIIVSIMEEKIVNDIDVVFIDYLQLITKRNSEKEYDVMRSVSTDLQDLAKKLKITIVALSQLSNEAIKNPNSNLIGFKGAGNIAASSDLAIEIYPQDNAEVRNEKLAKGEEIDYQINIKKNRHGRVGWIDMRFNGSTGIFREL